jgi:hypothetical protein
MATQGTRAERMSQVVMLALQFAAGDIHGRGT